MRIAGAATAVVALVLCVWGVGLIAKASNGGMPDSSTKAIVLIGVVIVGVGLFFGIAAARMLGLRRR